MVPSLELVFLGSYCESSEPGVYMCAFDPSTGGLRILDQATGLKNPTFLAVDGRKEKLYAIYEETNGSGQRIGGAASFNIDVSEGRLKPLNRSATTDAPTCHIELDRTRRNLIVSSYHAGLLGLNPVEEDGQVGSSSQVIQHHGSSILPVQDQARAHSAWVDPANRFVIVCDLGLDKLIVYRLDAGQHRLEVHSEASVQPGAGPRHFAFHPSGAFGYVINELNFTITAFAYDAEQGRLTEIHTVSTLPDGYVGENACADIHLSPDGRFLYGSNRGHDSIAVFSVEEGTGRLSLVEHVSTLGGHPRNFSLSPDGRFLLVANRDGDNIVTFRRDSATGKLEHNGVTLTVSKPVCIQFMNQP
ncbi:lactonase family protein [Gorillibacterium sp. sgz5001074]|uniref:lactonase family protein n=1 Tax=Gorillibacterium sp. sgz5001074 TaxID=3446695 RepID=UPI003F67D1EA